MNISQHVILPNKWLFGIYSYEGTLRAEYSSCLTHWFPISTLGFDLYVLDKNAISLYGNIFGRYEGQTSVSSVLLSDSSLLFTLNDNYCVFDSSSVSAPSKPFTYILI